MSATADRVCIVGAGPAGLATAAALRRAGVPFDLLERGDRIGGIWDADRPGSPMYETCHFISSRTLSAFRGFPMPDHYPDYPSWRQVRDYLDAFTDAHGLREAVRLGAPVERVERAPAGLRVTVAGSAPATYAGVVLATGMNQQPVLPELPGAFAGERIHASAYRRPSELAGRRVLVVGGGNSGADIACDASRAAEAAFWSVRRGYHVIPKHLFGVPADVFAETGPHLPNWLATRVFTVLLRVLQGDPRTLGLPRPDHRVLESHPLLNTQLPDRIRHGALHVRPALVRLDGDEAVFADGRREQVDLVICATGYRAEPSIVDPALLGRGGLHGRFLTTFDPALPELATVGLFEVNAGIYPFLSDLAELVAHGFATRHDPAARARFLTVIGGRPPDLGGGIRYVRSDRHRGYVDGHALHRAIGRVRDDLGLPG